MLTFRLDKAGRVELVVRRDCDVLGRRQVRGHAGTNRVGFRGRVHGHTLSPGTYTITVVVIRAGKRSRVGTLAVRIVHPSAHMSRAERVAPVSAQFCESAFGSGSGSGSGAPPAALLSAGAPLTGSAAHRAGSDPKSHKSRVNTSSFTPPKLPAPPFVDSSDGVTRLIAWILYGVMALAAVALLFALSEFARKQWPARG